ncbi:hypothetical protein RB195_017779 [Necator americanus]|uniref:Reverse transcriptase domain-containing protein n=1 Tax=Necator americanus TaxID=51031 RepID=A0ABR1C8J6_NECAM
MRDLEWDNMGMKVDDRYWHHLRLAYDIVVITSSVNQAERMLAVFDETCKKMDLQLNLNKTIFMRNGWVSDVPFTLNEYIRMLQLSVPKLGNQHDERLDFRPDLGRRKRAAWRAFKKIEDVVKRTKNMRSCSHLFNTTKFLPALTYASETWAFHKQEENAIRVI